MFFISEEISTKGRSQLRKKGEEGGEVQTFAYN
jgi:hypothetical protein